MVHLEELEKGVIQRQLTDFISALMFNEQFTSGTQFFKPHVKINPICQLSLNDPLCALV